MYMALNFAQSMIPKITDRKLTFSLVVFISDHVILPIPPFSPPPTLTRPLEGNNGSIESSNMGRPSLCYPSNSHNSLHIWNKSFNHPPHASPRIPTPPNNHPPHPNSPLPSNLPPNPSNSPRHNNRLAPRPSRPCLSSRSSTRPPLHPTTSSNPSNHRSILPLLRRFPTTPTPLSNLQVSKASPCPSLLSLRNLRPTLRSPLSLGCKLHRSSKLQAFPTIPPLHDFRLHPCSRRPLSRPPARARLAYTHPRLGPSGRNARSGCLCRFYCCRYLARRSVRLQFLARCSQSDSLGTITTRGRPVCSV